MMDIDDYYKDTLLLRRWTTVNGCPRCIEDAMQSTHPDATDVLARNAEVRGDLAAVEAYEAAVRKIDQLSASTPPPDVPAYTQDGEPAGVRPNPEWVEYEAAISVRDGASPRTLAFALVRASDEPPEYLGDGSKNPAWVEYRAALALIEG